MVYCVRYIENHSTIQNCSFKEWSVRLLRYIESSSTIQNLTNYRVPHCVRWSNLMGREPIHEVKVSLEHHNAKVQCIWPDWDFYHAPCLQRKDKHVEVLQVWGHGSALICNLNILVHLIVIMFLQIWGNLLRFCLAIQMPGIQRNG